MKTCVMKFASGKPCTWTPLAAFECCPYHALAYVAQRTGRTEAEVLSSLLETIDT